MALSALSGLQGISANTRRILPPVVYNNVENLTNRITNAGGTINQSSITAHEQLMANFISNNLITSLRFVWTCPGSFEGCNQLLIHESGIETITLAGFGASDLNTNGLKSAIGRIGLLNYNPGIADMSFGINMVEPPGADGATVIYGGDPGSNGLGLSVNNGANTAILYGGSSLGSSQILTTETGHFYATASRPSVRNYYKNGTLVSSGTGAWVAPTQGFSFLGDSLARSSYFFVANKVLSATEITNLLNCFTTFNTAMGRT